MFRRILIVALGLAVSAAAIVADDSVPEMVLQIDCEDGAADSCMADVLRFDTIGDGLWLPSLDSLIGYARRSLGCRYRYASGGPHTFDCSGFTSYVYRHFGISLPHSSGGQSGVARRVERNDLRRGDLVFFEGRRRNGHVGHVGLVVDTLADGTFTFIHASVQAGVIVSRSNEAYYAPRFLHAGRVTGSSPSTAGTASAADTPPIGAVSIVPPPTLADSTAAPAPQAQEKPQYHTVRKGDTLYSLARRYHTTVNHLKEINHLQSDRLSIGQRLKL